MSDDTLTIIPTPELLNLFLFQNNIEYNSQKFNKLIEIIIGVTKKLAHSLESPVDHELVSNIVNAFEINPNDTHLLNVYINVIMDTSKEIMTELLLNGSLDKVLYIYDSSDYRLIFNGYTIPF